MFSKNIIFTFVVIESLLSLDMEEFSYFFFSSPFYYIIILGIICHLILVIQCSPQIQH
jgi:glucan phosphoethanolaminetransferase (alkaline phosphatase superfamily)